MLGRVWPEVEKMIIRKSEGSSGPRVQGSGINVGVWKEGGGLAAEPGFEDESGGDLVDDIGAGLAVCCGLAVAGAVEEGVGFCGGVAFVEEVKRGGGGEVFGEVDAEGFGEEFGFGGLGAGFSAGVDREADEDCGYVVAADEAGDGFEVGLEGGAVDGEERLRGVAERIR